VSSDSGNVLEASWKPAETRLKLSRSLPFVKAVNAKANTMEQSAEFMFHAVLQVSEGVEDPIKLPSVAILQVIKREKDQKWLDGFQIGDFGVFALVLGTEVTPAVTVSFALLSEDEQLQTEEQEKAIVSGLMDLWRPPIAEGSEHTYHTLTADFCKSVLEIKDIKKSEVKQAFTNLATMLKPEEHGYEGVKRAYELEVHTEGRLLNR